MHDVRSTLEIRPIRSGMAPARPAAMHRILLALCFLTACSNDDSTGGSAGSGGSGGTAGSAAGGSAGTEAGVGGSAGTEAGIPDPTGFRDTGALSHPRRNFTLTKLADGRVIAIGGDIVSDVPTMIAEVELYDPVTETWTDAAPLPEPRANHQATLLVDGHVLVTGGGPTSIIGLPSGPGSVATAVLFDPVQNAWTPTGAMNTPRAAHQAARLSDGRVLVVGGGTDQSAGTCAPQYPDCTVPVATNTAEVWDPASGEFTNTPLLATARFSFTLTALASGELLAVGGVDTNSTKSTELLEQATLAWTSVGDLNADRFYHGGTLLPSGSVLVAGGKKANVSPLSSAELYDPAQKSFALTAQIDPPRTSPILVTLPSGRALIAGGYNQLENAPLDVAALFDESVAGGTWTAIEPLGTARSLEAGVLLDSGKLLVCGGTTPILAYSNGCELTN